MSNLCGYLEELHSAILPSEMEVCRRCENPILFKRPHLTLVRRSHNLDDPSPSLGTETLVRNRFQLLLVYPEYFGFQSGAHSSCLWKPRLIGTHDPTCFDYLASFYPIGVNLEGCIGKTPLVLHLESIALEFHRN